MFTLSPKSVRMLLIALAVLVLMFANIACESSGGTCDKLETCNPAADLMAQPEFQVIDKANDALFPAP